MDKHFTIILLIFIIVLILPDMCLLIENFETKNALEKTRAKICEGRHEEQTSSKKQDKNLRKKE